MRIEFGYISKLIRSVRARVETLFRSLSNLHELVWQLLGYNGLLVNFLDASRPFLGSYVNRLGQDVLRLLVISSHVTAALVLGR